DDRGDDREDGDRAVLAIEERHGALEDQAGNFLHRLGALVLGQHVAREPEGKQDGEDAREQHDRPEFHKELCSSYIPDDHPTQAAVKVSGMAADRAERGSSTKTTHGDASHAAAASLPPWRSGRPGASPFSWYRSRAQPPQEGQSYCVPRV